jgi:hypothetical protein
MTNRRLLLFLILIGIAAGNALAQISVSNQMEYSSWQDYNREVLENWLDVSCQQDAFAFGLRHEINQPPDPFIYPADSLVEQEAITFKYVEIYHENLTLTVGNYYAMFGRGMTLRTYENRNLRVDNNLEGVKANYYADNFEVTALGGRMRDKYNRRDDRLYGIDGEVRPWDGISFGGSFLRSQRADEDFTDMRAIRADINLEDFSLYAEAAKPSRVEDWSLYVAASYFFDRFSLLAEYKDYNRLGFYNRYGTEYNAPPALTREHSYTLLNRHPHALNTNDEVGYQLEGTAEITDELSLLLNYSYTETHDKQRLFEEYFGKLNFLGIDDWHFEGGLGWNFDFTTRTENITPLLMGEYTWGGVNEIHAEIQHQHITSTYDKSEYDDELFVLEYTRSPFLGLALVAEISNRDQLPAYQDEDNSWIYGEITYTFLGNQQISVLYGKRQAGFVCAGGVCRYEPEFNGVEVKFISRF